MAGGCVWSRRIQCTRMLRRLVHDTQRAVRDICDKMPFEPELLKAVQDVGDVSDRPAVLVLLGSSAEARARLLHCLLGRKLLPDQIPRGCRWIRVQYGTTTQVHLTLGNSDYELVEELECNRRPWETLPIEDLVRQDQTDLSTLLEVELNNSFLRDGIRVLLPPDIDPGPNPTENLQSLKEIHSELYSKRELILQDFTPIYLYAMDKIGKNIFSENFISDPMTTSKSDEDLWNIFSLYHMTRPNTECDIGGVGENGEINNVHRGECVSGVSETKVTDHDAKCDDRQPWQDRGGTAVFNAENCLDLHQVKQMDPHAQLLFVLFADSGTLNPLSEDRRTTSMEATESTEDTVYKELPESDQGLLNHKNEPPLSKDTTDTRRLHEEQTAFMNELLDQWELITTPPPKHYVKSQTMILDDVEILKNSEPSGTLAPSLSSAIQANDASSRKKDGDRERIVKNKTTLTSTVMRFARDSLQSCVLEYSNKLSEVHVKLLQQFILASFDMARELQVVPKKIQYVARKEQQLYETINEKFSQGDKKQELLKIMQEVLEEMRSDVNNMDWSVDDLPCHQDRRFVISNSVFYSSHGTDPSDSVRSPYPNPSDSSQASDGEEAVSYDSYNFDDYDIIHSNDDSLSVSDSYRKTSNQYDTSSLAIDSIQIENELDMVSGWSSLRRELGDSAGASDCTNNRNISLKQASLDVQKTVLSKLSRKISLKLVKFVDCLKDTYFGTLQRCLESLEFTCRHELGGRPASEAMRLLLSVARQVDLQPCASFSLLSSLMESLKRLFYKMRAGGAGGAAAGACCALSPLWRRRVALAAADSLSAQRLARVISGQILERLSVAHERYQSALASLETALANRLHHTGDVKLAIRKKYAPSFARLCLESTSLCDLLMYGTPELGKEIGRGQYGVVYAVGRKGWGGHTPAAVKSVLPADERHYHELAMEFFYTRSIPPHPRIVRLYGSIVQRHSGAGPSVLLVSERKVRDLHAAVRAGLSRASRMRISCDIVEGIRYLHSLGLVHRDIKMKNVLLDAEARASLSDLGFCAAEALMSGSVVGTPVHMAPELPAGDYDASVDVYAFGILFWYVCAGNIKLPSAFEMFQNKEQLWSKVKKGLRPERLPHFTDECWEVMESCWAPDPLQRAHLGDVQPKLERILQDAIRDEQYEPYQHRNTVDNSDDDSLYMTGVDKNGM